MKKPNDTKRPNSKSGSLGQLYRRREKLVHVSKAFILREHHDDGTGVVTIIPELDMDRSQFTYQKPREAEVVK